MALPMMASEPSKLTNSLDFESKGLSHPSLVSFSRLDGKEARLVVKALFRGPRQGWPLLDRQKILDAANWKVQKEGVAGTSVLGDDSEKIGPSQPDVPICLEDLDVKYPIHVQIRIALTSQPGAVEDMLKDARAYSQLYANGYIPFELPVAMWRTVEGIWSVVIDEGGVPLPSWWEFNVQPQIHSSESRWKIGSWRLKGPGHDGEAISETVNDLKEQHREEHQEQKKRLRFLDEASQQIQNLLKKKETLALKMDGDSVPEEVRAEQDKVVSTLHKKTQETTVEDVAETDKLAAPTPQSDDEQEISLTEKQEWAARIQQHKADMEGPPTVIPEMLPLTQQIGVDEDEAESMMIDKGWLQAVNVLIQIADTILSLHERRLCMVVCRPEFFNVCETRPFVPRSGLPSETQPFSVQLTHLGTVVQMPGYDDGKLVGHMNGDFDGDKVTAMGPGSASAFTNFGSTGSPSDDEEWMVDEDEGVGALKGVLDEASILRHLQYIAPEAISSTRAIGSTVDIFTWGMTAYELLKGKGQEGTESDDDKNEFYRAIHLHSTRAMPTMTSLCPSMPPELSAIVKKALALDPDERYSNFCSLLHDLHQVKQICDGSLRGQPRRDFVVGHIDYLSRFAIPPGLVDREEEYGMLDEAYNVVRTTGRSQVVCCWGVSGSGKSKLLELWARQKEASNAGQDCFVSWAKMDQHLVKPLSAFISVFCSLLERVFSDPLESAADWRQRILNSLAVNANVFLALLPKEWRAILLDGQSAQEMDSDTTAGIDWESWVKQFRTWSYGLLRLFASENRPLLVIIDDVQWLEKSERELWEELITSETRRLDHCLILFSYRTQSETAPDISPLVPQYMIQARPFSEATVTKLVNQCFHLDDIGHLPEQWTSLCSYLHKNTKGNPFDLKWNLSTLVRDGDIAFSYQSQEWTVRKTVLNSHPDLSAEDFAASVLSSLSHHARVVLCHLACLPSRGVEIALLSQLVHKSENTVKTLLDECASLGSVIMRGTKVQFVHDKPHTAALALIDPQEKPRLFAKIARDLEGSSTDYSFLRADLYIQAREANPDLIEPMEVVIASVRAARQAAASAALDLASSYVDEASKFWSFSSSEAWAENPELAMDLLTITVEIALGRRTASSVIENVLLARDNAAKLSARLDISAWLVKLQLSASCPNLALQAFFDSLRLLGYDSPAETTAYPPTPVKEDEIRAIASASPPPDTEEAKIAISLASLVAIAMPTVYSFEVDKAYRIMQFVTAIYLHHRAAKAVSTTYSWYVMAVLLANGLDTLGRAKAFIDLGDTFDIKGHPLEGIVETVRATLAFIKTSSLKTIDYSRAKSIASQTKNHDVLSYTLGLDLSAQALSGHSIPDLYNAGRDTLTALADDLQPAIRLMVVPFIEFGAHLMDSHLIQADSNLAALNVLEGEYVTPQDAKDISQRPPFYAAVYAIASLYLGLLFRAPDAALRERVKLLRDNQQGGTGTIVRTFSHILLSVTSLVLDDATDVSSLESTYRWLNALPHNEDFRAIVCMLKALEKIKASRANQISWPEVFEVVEEALEALEHARSYLFAGLLCLHAQDALKSRDFMSRIRRGYLHHAQAAFSACGASNLVLLVDGFLNALPPSGALSIKEDKSVNSDPSTTMSEGFLSHDVASTSSEEININGTDLPPKQKLGLESILRSFLILASERDSDGLIRRVLQVLLQVTCSSYACFATQDPATGSLKLKGYGSYDNLRTCDISMAEAKGIAPTILLSHCSITKKPINAGNASTPANANLLRREPFFAKTGPPRTLLALPLFVQGRFSALLFLSGKVSNAHPSTSQVGLLATFAAIILESNHAYATLESAVEMRTQQLQHALHSRSTFISGVSHEIRTPLFAIAGLCSVMEASADLTDSQRENLNVIRQSSDDLQRIVTAVLDWSKLDARSITAEAIPFDLRNVVENALETVTHIARSKNIRLLLENPVTTDPQMPLLGDPHRYRQCLLNLLSNAIKFTKSTAADHYSTVSVSWSWQERADKIEITCAVKDEGIGIAAKSMHRLFHSFSQVDSGISRNFGGTGLGLSITRGLARLLGGDCWAESVEGQGSTFYILITAAKTSEADAERPPAYPAGPARQAVLYAPRCLASSVILANLLAFGVTAHIADIANETPPAEGPEYVLVDMDDPLANLESVQRLRARHRNSKFIFLVTLTDVSKYKDLALSHDAIVTKPIKAQSLYNATKNSQTSDTGGSAKAAQKKLTMDNTYSKRYPLRVCYIDDSSVNVAVGKKILSKFGYKDIDVCYDGNQAVEAAERTKYDLMLMDLQMPNMDGHTARRLIAENPNCGNPMVVALTANCDQPTKDRCLREGFADFLSKPLIISDLAKLLIRAYEEKQEKAGATPV